MQRDYSEVHSGYISSDFLKSEAWFPPSLQPTKWESLEKKRKKKEFGNSPYLERVDTKWIGKEKQGCRKNSLIYTEPQKAFV